MGSGVIQVRFEDRQAAVEAYRSGLQHGLITTRVDDAPAVGAHCKVRIELPFADAVVEAAGAVAHHSRVATVIRLGEVPQELHQLIAGRKKSRKPRSSSQEPGWSTAAPYPTTDDGEDRGPRTITRDGDPDGVDEPPARASRASADGGSGGYLAARLRQSGTHSRWARDRRRSMGSQEITAVSHTPTPTPTPEVTTATPLDRGIPVPHEPTRFLPAVAQLQGSLDETSPYRLLAQIYASRSTGVLVLNAGPERYWAFFIGGRPAHYLRHPSLQSESIETLLIRKRILSPSVLDRARWHAEVTGQPLVSIVLRLRLVSERQLHQLRTEQIKLITRRILDRDEGHYRFFEAPDLRELFRNPPVSPIPMLWKRLAFSWSHRSEARVRSRLDRVRTRGAHVTPLGEKIARKLPLADDQRAFLKDAVRPGVPVQAALGRTTLEERKAAELLLQLEQLGVLDFVRVRRRTDPEAARKERALRDLIRRLDRDHFEFLEVHWSSLPTEIRGACDRIEAELADMEDVGAHVREFDKVRPRIEQRIADLRALAEDDDARQAYRSVRVEDSERTMAAEMYLKQGEMALFRRDAAQARECFERLLEIDPRGAGSAERTERARLVLMAFDEGEVPDGER